MKRALIAGISIFVAWTLLDAVGHRAALQPLYASADTILRPVSEMSPVLVTAVTILLVVIFVVGYTVFARPKSVVRGLLFGGLLGAALGVSSGFGTYIHSPIPVGLAWGWFALGTIKGLAAGAALGASIREGNHLV